jgi:hypothetical protein
MRYERVAPVNSWRTGVEAQNACGGVSGCQNEGVKSWFSAVPGITTGNVPPLTKRLLGGVHSAV